MGKRWQYFQMWSSYWSYRAAGLACQAFFGVVVWTVVFQGNWATPVEVGSSVLQLAAAYLVLQLIFHIARLDADVDWSRRNFAFLP